MVLVLAVALITSWSIVHVVPFGHVGTYSKGGVLLSTFTEPGFHLKIPLITQFQPIKVINKVNQVKDIPFSTKDGAMINFETIKVVSRLHKEYLYDTLLNYDLLYDKLWIDEKIHHEINLFCGARTLQEIYVDNMSHRIRRKMRVALQGNSTPNAAGIVICWVRVVSPVFPDSLRRNEEKMLEERMKNPGFE
ncbi:hypothetical protein GIB67_009540 [Kingdonia uniflora]|uniref:Band 7 domain-containing protein n=1 Tax=Kingdonia uniflora TaxID=39325 RepID=A0A7J7NW71_9MAGN|nr:hypothetical protein GIB67_009540 [Kingdonia uniflora]